jgi:hypothetical protein
MAVSRVFSAASYPAGMQPAENKYYFCKTGAGLPA